MSAAAPGRGRQDNTEKASRRWLARLAAFVSLCFVQTLNVVYDDVRQFGGTWENFDTANTGCRYDQEPVSHL